jgi:hypothetical protein
MFRKSERETSGSQAADRVGRPLCGSAGLVAALIAISGGIAWAAVLGPQHLAAIAALPAGLLHLRRTALWHFLIVIAAAYGCLALRWIDFQGVRH